MGGGAGELQDPVGVVFDYEDVVLLAEVVDLAAALEGEDAGGWVLAHAVFC